MNMYAYQDSLPKLPLPALHATCQKLMHWSEPFLSQAEIKMTRDAIRTFQDGGVGTVLQQHLSDLSRDPGISNWLETLWAESYLCNPAPLPTGSNVTFILEKNPQMKNLSLPEFLTSLISALFKFNELILAERLDADFQGKKPLCMAQYKTLLGTARVPGEREDTHITAANTAHVIILHRGHYYQINVLDRNRKIISPAALLQQVREIMQTPKTDNRLAAGILTNLPRRKWAQLRKHLAGVSPQNEKSLHQVESALAFFVIDEERHPHDGQMFKHFFCGNAANRWYDKSLQFILNEAGDFGINYEHSGVDGTTLGRLVAYLYEQMGPLDASSFPGTAKTPVHEITFALDKRLEAAIKEAETLSREAYHQHSFEVLSFTEFGKGRVKTLGVSPDGFVQIGMQLAQHGVFQNVYNVYESVMTKRYLCGRTETMRPVTKESLAFVKNPTLENLRAASLKHVERINECQAGQGIDRHLYGLKKMHEKLFPEAPLPELFTSPGYLAITTNYFSTSTSHSLAMRYAGYGPSVEDGFAARYLIYEDRFHFVLSCKKHRADALQQFKASLENSFKKMAALTAVIQ